MRILHLLSQTELTGSEAYAHTLVTHQVKQGQKVWVISDQLHLNFPGQTEVLPISTPSFWRRMLNIWKLRKFIKTHQIDLIHGHSRAACRHAFWATRFTRVALLTTLHGYQHVSFSKKLFNIYGDTILCVCEKIRDQLIQQFGLREADCKVLRNPIAFPENIRMDRKKNILALMGRASGPKGERLKQIFLEQAQGWLDHSKDLEINFLLTGLTERDKALLLHSLKESQRARVRLYSEKMDLNSFFESARWVMASGRIAVEAAFYNCEVIAIGEARLAGRIDLANLESVLVDNFGDVGPTQVLDTQAVSHEFRKSLRYPLNSAELEKIRDRLRYEFSNTRICDEVFENSRATCLWKKTGGLPILMYHKIPNEKIQTKHRIFVTAENFERHLLFFQNKGFQTLNFQDLSDFWFERRPLSEFPAKPLLLTFDDGYRDNLENALPLLEKYQMKAQLFLLADLSIRENNWDEPEGPAAPLLTSVERKSLPQKTFTIGSHGLQHLDLRSLSETEVLHQMKESKRLLEEEFSTSVNTFAYPFGWVDERLPRLAREAGYEFAVMTDHGALRWVDDRFSLFRINVFPEDSWFALWKKTSPGYRARYFRKRGH